MNIGCTKNEVCAYCSMLKYKQLLYNLPNCSVTQDSPFFQTSLGGWLSKPMFVQQTHLYLSLLHINPSDYSGHSYRGGGATSAAMAGLADWEIKLLGRWKSNVYLRYIKAPVSMLVGFAPRMAVMLQKENVFKFRQPYLQNIL